MLKITVMRTPSVELDGKPVSFPFKRADALLYYMAVQKSATRQELVSLLWEDCEETNGLKQLRNTLYHLKKILGGELLISSQKSLIRVNPEWEVDCDYDRFVRDRDLNAYGGEFLQGFGVKRAFAFEEWMCRTADRLREQYLEMIRSAAEEAMTRGDHREAAKHYAEGLAEDELNENLVAGFMECCRCQQDYSRGAELYQNLRSRLKEELGTEPLERTRELYYQILNQWDEHTAVSYPAPPVGREQAFLTLCHGMEELENGGEDRYLWLISGEAGTGKHQLVDFFLRWGPVENHRIQRAECLGSEQSIPLMTWEHLLRSLWDMAETDHILLPVSVLSCLETNFALTERNHPITGTTRMARRADRALEEAVRTLLDSLTKIRPILLVLENIHWMDDESLRLLAHFLEYSPRLGILMTCRQYNGDVPRDTIRRVTEFAGIRKESLSHLSLRQVHTLLERELSTEEADQLAEEYFRETCGDVHLLQQLIRARGDSGRAPEMVLFGNLQGLSEQALRTARILSVYPGDLVSSQLLRLYGNGEKSLTHAISELLRAKVIEEIHMDREENCYRLIHPRLREMIYERMSVFERRTLHGRIAEMMAERAELEGIGFPEISRQYELAGDHRRSLDYRIRELSRIATLICVPFLPETQGGTPVTVDAAEILEQISRCQNDLHSIYGEESEAGEALQMKCDLLEIRGIIEIYQGHYAQGVATLGNISGISTDRREQRQLRICLLLGDLAIRQQEVEKAERYLATGMRILERKRNDKALAAFRRLHGCCFMLRQSYDKAGYYLIEAIDSLENHTDFTGDRLQLALAYCDYGRLSRYQNKYAKACSFFKKSIAALDGQTWSFCVWIYVHYGRTVYALEDHLTARELFAEACRIAELTGELLGQTAAESYAAIYAARAENIAETVRHLERAAGSVDKAASPLEASIFYYSRMTIRRMIDRHQLESEILHDLLPESAVEYARKGILEMGEVQNVYEVEEMQAMLRGALAQKDRYKASDLYSKNKWFMTE